MINVKFINDLLILSLLRESNPSNVKIAELNNNYIIKMKKYNLLIVLFYNFTIVFYSLLKVTI